MKLNFTSLILAIMLTCQAHADKPAWAGQGKPSDAQKAEHRAAMQAKESSVKDADEISESLEKEQKKIAKEKHKQKIDAEKNQDKINAEQKELDKGSEQGQLQREKRKKWWRFWGDDES